MSEFNLNKVWAELKGMDTTFPGYITKDETQEEFNDQIVSPDVIDEFEDIEPEDYEDDFDFEDEEDFDCVNDCEEIQYVEPDPNVMCDELPDTPTDATTEKDIIAWADTTNFVISAKRLTEFLGDVLFQPDRWIGSIQGYEDYMCTGEYYILALNSTHGLIVSLVYENIEDKGIYVTIALNDEGVTLLKVNAEGY